MDIASELLGEWRWSGRPLPGGTQETSRLRCKTRVAAGRSGVLSVGAPPPEGSSISTEWNYVRPDPPWRGGYVGN